MSTTASIDIFEPRDSQAVNRLFNVKVTKGGAPLSGTEVVFAIEGSGSLASQFSAVEAKRETDAQGKTYVGWYRRSIWGRDMRARITATVAQEGAEIAFEPTEQEVSRTSYNMPTRPLRF